MNEQYNYLLEDAVRAYATVNRFTDKLEEKKSQLIKALGLLSAEDLNEYVRRTTE
ncbi:MAG: hypothetical protein ACREOZ_02085 [Gloeomargaritales cyanobacterium]